MHVSGTGAILSGVTGFVQILPTPMDPVDIERVEHTRLRRRLMYSQHESDLLGRMRVELGDVRADFVGKPDLTANLPLSLWSQVSVLYNDEPETMTDAVTAQLVSRVADVGLWPLMQRVQRDTLGFREMLMDVQYDEEDKAPIFRPVYPDMVTARGDPRRPSRAIEISEARNTEEYGWCWFRRSIAIPEMPTFHVTTMRGDDVTRAVLGGAFDGPAYPYRYADGRPHLSYAWYHAAETGFLFDPYTLREIVEASLNVGVLLSYYRHVVRNAAWAQRYTVGTTIRGVAEAGTLPQDARKEIVADPATVLQMDQSEGSAQALVGQWGPPVDPESILRSISAYERRAKLLAGFQDPDVTRQEADVRSGYSLAVSREAVRDAQRVFEPQFRKGDQALLAMAAAVINRAEGTSYSEIPASYRLRYRGLPETPIEMQARLSELDAKQNAGLIGPIGAYVETHPGITREEAILALAEAALERADVQRATDTLLRASGGEQMTEPLAERAPKAAPLAIDLLVRGADGSIPPDSVVALLRTVAGFSATEAEAAVAPIRAMPARVPVPLPSPMASA